MVQICIMLHGVALGLAKECRIKSSSLLYKWFILKKPNISVTMYDTIKRVYDFVLHITAKYTFLYDAYFSVLCISKITAIKQQSARIEFCQISYFNIVFI